MKKLNKKSEGITLIALVITIIVLLILAAVSIATLTGDNGILTKATNSAEQSKRAGALEKVQVEVAGAIGENLKVDMGLLKENLKKNLGLTDGDITENLDGSITVPVDGYLITVETNGEVHEGEKEIKKVEGSSSDWELNEAKDTIVKYVGDGFDGDTIVIPNCVDGNRIVAIGEKDPLFKDNKDIIESKKLQISSGIERIQFATFAGYSGLIGNLIIPSTVKEINSGAFNNCSGFQGDLIIPNSVTTIMGGSFLGCTGLNGNLTIPSSVTTLQAGAFSSTFQGTLTIGAPDIPSGMFSGSKFTKLILEDTVKTIGDGAFAGCTGLTGKLNIPVGVTSIGVSSFASTGFQSVVISDTVETLNSNVFQNCTSLTDVTINAIDTLKSDAFKGCTNITNLTIDGIGTIEANSFKECTNVTDLVIRNLDEITSSMFNGCQGNMINLEINHVKTIKQWAFMGCDSLNIAKISNVELIDDQSFIGSSAKKLIISQVKKIYNAFIYNHELESVEISDVDILDLAFGADDKLDTVKMINVKQICNGAFQECSSLSSIRIPASVSIMNNIWSYNNSSGFDVFLNCPNLTSIILEKGSPLEIPEDKWGATNATITREQ